jgi:hypothetical protein
VGCDELPDDGVATGVGEDMFVAPTELWGALWFVAPMELGSALWLVATTELGSVLWFVGTCVGAVVL